jgi:hypothetical protein
MLSERYRRFLTLCTLTAVALAAALAVGLSLGAPLAAQAPRNLLDRAVADFEAGRVVESAEGFDAVIDASPSVAPQLWHRAVLRGQIRRLSGAI